jgi:large subunit ribosomal protein L25
MARNESTALKVAPREPSGSRDVRRLRRQGNVPGIVYGGGEDPVAFQVQARELRLALAHAGAVFDLAIEGSAATPVVVKELDRHPVSGETMHIDFMRVRLDVKIQATVFIELTGGDDSPGVKEGGVLEHVTRELTIQALPTDIPDLLHHDVSAMVIGDTLTLDALSTPDNVELMDDPETVIATLSPPKLQLEEDEEIESETEVVGEGGTAGEAGGQGAEPAAEGGDGEGGGGEADSGAE